MSMLKNDCLIGNTLITRQPSAVKVAFAKDADINTIVNRFMKTGSLPVSSVPPQFVDTHTLPASLQDAMAAVRAAQDAFQRLPVDVQREANAHPKGLEGWLSDPRNIDIAVKHGMLIKKPVADAPVLPLTGHIDGPSSAQGGKGGGEPPKEAVKPA